MPHSWAEPFIVGTQWAVRERAVYHLLPCSGTLGLPEGGPWFDFTQEYLLNIIPEWELMAVLAREINISWATDKPPNLCVFTQSKFASPSCPRPTRVRLSILWPSHLNVQLSDHWGRTRERYKRHLFLPLPWVTHVTSFPVTWSCALPTTSPFLLQCPHPCSSCVWEPQVWWRHFFSPFGCLLKLLPNTHTPEVTTYFGIAKAVVENADSRALPETMAWDSAFPPSWGTSWCPRSPGQSYPNFSHL